MNSARRQRLVVGVLIVIASSILVWSDLDWPLLAGGGRQLVGAAGLHVYVKDGALQAGPVALGMFAALQELGRPLGPIVVHLLIWIAGGFALYLADAAGSSRRKAERALVRGTFAVPRWLIAVIGLAPFLLWHLPPVNFGLLGLWSALAITLGALAWLPDTHELIVKHESLTHLELCALLTVSTWAILASGSAHLEDAVATLLLVSAVSLAERNKYLAAAVAVGVAVATKPWAVAGVAILWRRERPRTVIRDLSVTGAVAGLAWLPFVLAAPGTLHAADRPFILQHVVPMALFLKSGGAAPTWLRSAQLLGICAAAFAARRSGPADCVAAGMCARLFFDPGSSTYYISTAILAIAAADLVSGRRPTRLAFAVVGLWVAPVLTSSVSFSAATNATVQLMLIASYVTPSGLRQRIVERSEGLPAVARALAQTQSLTERRRASPG